MSTIRILHDCSFFKAWGRGKLKWLYYNATPMETKLG